MVEIYINQLETQYKIVLKDNVLKFALKKHAGQKRKGGKEFIYHPLSVVELLLEHGIKERDVIHAAICHDLLEDERASYDELKSVLSNYSFQIVLLLTKDRKESTRKYLRRIKKNADAFNIKVADRISNLLDSLTSNDFDFIERYYKHSQSNYTKLICGTIWESKFEESIEKVELYLKKR